MFELRDRHLGIVGLVLCGGLLYTLKNKSFQAKAFPIALLLILMVLCLLLIFRQGHEEKYDFSGISQVLIYGGLFVLYVWLMPYIGFILSTTGFLAAFLILQKYPMKQRWILLFSLIIALVLWLLFAKGFGVRLPEILF